jgi:hypothetical protein
MRRSAPIGFLLAAVVAAGCGGKSAADFQNEARAALDAGEAARAVAVADEGLAVPAVKADAASAWRLEQIRVDALAKGGKGADVKATLERLAAAYPQQVNAAMYRALADRLKAAGDTNGAIDVLAAGDKRFPAESASFVEAIEALKSAGNLDPATVERLKALGYL